MTDPFARERSRRVDAGCEARSRTLDRLARSLSDELRMVKTALTAELWASGVASGWQQRPLLADVDHGVIVGGGLVEALERTGGRGGLAALRALAAVAEDPLGAASAAAADRVAAGGVPDPEWASEVARARPTEARLVREEIFDDGVSVLVEFEQADGSRHVLGVYVDHNLSGLAKDIFVGGPLREVTAIISQEGDDQIRLKRIRIAEAAARIRSALELTDLRRDAPVTGDFLSLRALAGARLRTLPPVQADTGWREVSRAERDALLAGFLSSPEGEPIRHLAGAQAIVSLAIEFCADSVDGQPLRWSPVVVELFMGEWLPRRLAREPASFTGVPDVLRRWISYAGRRRGIPDAAVAETLAAVDEWTPALLGAADRQAWGPQHASAVAALAAEAG